MYRNDGDHILKSQKLPPTLHLCSVVFFCHSFYFQVSVYLGQFSIYWMQLFSQSYLMAYLNRCLMRDQKMSLTPATHLVMGFIPSPALNASHIVQTLQISQIKTQHTAGSSECVGMFLCVTYHKRAVAGWKRGFQHFMTGDPGWRPSR